MVGVTIEPSNSSCKTYGRVDGFRIGDVSENPADTTHIVRVLSPNGFQISYTHS